MSHDGKGREIKGQPIAYWKCEECGAHMSGVALELGICTECKAEHTSIPVYEPMDEEC